LEAPEPELFEPVPVLAVPPVRFLLPPATPPEGLPPLDAFATAISVAISSPIGPIKPIIAGFIALPAVGKRIIGLGP
jgi:hypothetical protein